MRIAMIGLGRMGANMTTRLLEGGHDVLAFDLSKQAVEKAKSGGAEGAFSLEEIVQKLEPKRVAWVMVPAGEPVETSVARLGDLFEKGDIIIDGGNSNYKDSLRRGDQLAERGIAYVDVGVSGGIWGLKEGYGMMVGGDDKAVAKIRPILETLAPAPDKRLGPYGSARRRPFRQDGPQRDRVRDDASLRRRLRHPESQGAVRPRPPPGGRGLALWHGDPVLAPRLDRQRIGGRCRAWPTSPPGWTIPARAAGPPWKPSTWPSRRR